MALTPGTTHEIRRTVTADQTADALAECFPKEAEKFRAAGKTLDCMQGKPAKEVLGCASEEVKKLQECFDNPGKQVPENLVHRADESLGGQDSHRR